MAAMKNAEDFASRVTKYCPLRYIVYGSLLIIPSVIAYKLKNKKKKPSAIPTIENISLPVSPNVSPPPTPAKPATRKEDRPDLSSSQVEEPQVTPTSPLRKKSSVASMSDWQVVKKRQNVKTKKDKYLDLPNVTRQPLWKSWWEAQFNSRTFLFFGKSWMAAASLFVFLYWTRIFDPAPKERLDKYWLNSRINEWKDHLYKLREQYLIEKHPGIQYLVQSLSTGSRVIDVVIGIVMFVITAQITATEQTDFVGLISPVITAIVRFFFQSQITSEIEFLVENESHANNYFTPTYRAIMHKLGNLDSPDVWKFKEQNINWFDSAAAKNLNESMYQVSQSEPIKIRGNLWVRCEYKTKSRDNDQGVMTIHSYKIVVYSTKYDTHYLKNVVAGWAREYSNYKSDQLDGKLMIFVVRFPELSYKTDDKSNEDIQFSRFQSFRTFDNLYFEQKDQLLSELNFFLNEKDWHKKRGILCHGVPGCGKTSFIKALLKQTQRHGVVFAVNHGTKLDAIERLMRSETLCDFPIPQHKRIYILEDIDAMGDVVKRRTAEEETGKEEEEVTSSKDDVTHWQFLKYLKYDLKKSSAHHLGFFLNLLDGLVETPGRIIVMTTNHIEKLDPALIRPGRIDIILEFVPCSRLVMGQMLSHFFKEKFSVDDLDDTITDGCITPAELTQICRANKLDFKAALVELTCWSNLWNERQTALGAATAAPHVTLCEDGC